MVIFSNISHVGVQLECDLIQGHRCQGYRSVVGCFCPVSFLKKPRYLIVSCVVLNTNVWA